MDTSITECILMMTNLSIDYNMKVTLININGVSLKADHWAVNSQDRFLAVEHEEYISQFKVKEILSKYTLYSLTLVYNSNIPLSARKNLTLLDAIEYVKGFRFIRNYPIEVAEKLTLIGESKTFKPKLNYLSSYNRTYIYISGEIQLEELQGLFPNQKVYIGSFGSPYLVGHYIGKYYPDAMRVYQVEVNSYEDHLIADNFETIFNK